MGIFNIFVGFLLIANPCINLLDFLPDFIGYLLIRRGLFKFDYIDSHLSEAREGFYKLYLFGLAKFLLMFMIPGADDNTRLLVSFACCVVEILLLWTAVPNLFDGFFSLATRYDAKNAFVHYSSARFLTYVFLIAKNILILLPDLFTVFILDADVQGAEDVEHQLIYAQNLALPLTMIVTALFAIYTAYHLYLFFRDLAKDKPFMDRLQAKYKEVFLDDENLQTRRAIRLFTRYAGYAFLFFMNFFIDGFGVLPDFIGAVLLIYAFYVLRKLVPIERKEMICLSLGALLSAVSWGYRVSVAVELLGKESFMYEFGNRILAYPMALLGLFLPIFSYIFAVRRIKIVCARYTSYDFSSESRLIFGFLAVFCFAHAFQYAFPMLQLPWGWLCFVYCAIFIFRVNGIFRAVYREARIKLLR